MSALMSTPEIWIAGSKAETLQLSFDSSWRPYAEQTALITASYDGADAVEVDDPGVRLGAVAHEVGVLGPQIDREAQPVADHRRAACHQRFRRVKRRQFCIVQHRPPVAEPDLVEPHAGAHQHRERPRADFGVERPGIPFGDPVEFGAAIGDGPREQVEPPGGAFGVGDGVDSLGQGEAFEQRHEVDAALFQHRPVRKVDPVHLEFLQPLRHPLTAAGEKRRPHAVGHMSQSQIEAGGLHLTLDRRDLHPDRAVGDKRFDLLACKHTCHGTAPGKLFRSSSKAGRGGKCQSAQNGAGTGSEGVIGRASRTRTCDLPSPRRTRYQAAL